MVFTEEDAENDGKIKREAGNQLNSVLSRESGQLYQHFMEYCNEYGYDPAVILGDMALKAMKDEDYANSVANTTVNVGVLSKQSIREEDLELVTSLMEKFEDDDDDDDDIIEKMVERRLEGVGRSPLSGLSDSVEEGNNRRRDEELQKLRQEVERLRQNKESSSGGEQQGEPDATVEVETEERKSVDDLFDGDDKQNNDTGTDNDGGVAVDEPSDNSTSGDRQDDEGQDELDNVNLGQGFDQDGQDTGDEEGEKIVMSTEEAETDE